jgi:hypothetical protein
MLFLIDTHDHSCTSLRWIAFALHLLLNISYSIDACNAAQGPVEEAWSDSVTNSLIFEYEYYSSVFIFEYLTEYIRIPIRISYLK